MNSSMAAENFEKTFEFVPIAGLTNVSRLRLRPGSKIHEPSKEMTQEDWDKFEQDIEEAFEKAP